MLRICLQDAIDMLPHYNPGKPGVRDDWRQKGRRVLTNAKTTPTVVDKCIEKIVKRVDHSQWVETVQWVDVTGDNVWVLHRSLSTRTLNWLAAHLWSWQKLRFRKLPIYIFYKGRIIVWNGTHRMTLGRLARKKIRARVLDLDKFLVWEKKHPELCQPKTVKVIKVKPRKKGPRT